MESVRDGRRKTWFYDGDRRTTIEKGVTHRIQTYLQITDENSLNQLVQTMHRFDYQIYERIIACPT